jgi:hypothetical protein
MQAEKRRGVLTSLFLKAQRVMRSIIDRVNLWYYFSRLSFLILAATPLVLNDCIAYVQQSPNKTLPARQRININEGIKK